MKFSNADQLLDFAISEEVRAAEFYRGLAKRMERPWMARTFDDFAAEEMRHKAILEDLKKGGELKPLDEKIPDLKILETIQADETPSPDMSYKDALIVAMKAEKEAYLLYSSLADLTEDGRIRDIMLRLAQEEAKHKLKFETEYDDVILQEN